MSKPNNPKCNTCFVEHNILRCMVCKYKTEEWVYENCFRPVIMLGEKDMYKKKSEAKE